jgi:hypothetical protein
MGNGQSQMANGKFNCFMKTLPDKIWIRRGEVRGFLGISEETMTKLVASGALEAIRLAGMTRAFFLRDQVQALARGEFKTEPKHNNKRERASIT